MRWLVWNAVIATAALPVCKVVAFCTGSTFVAPQLVASNKKRVGSIAPFSCEEVLSGALEVEFSSFSGLAFQNMLLYPEWEAFGERIH